MATKLVNGVRVTLSAQEEADLEASRTPTLAQAKRAKVEALRSVREDKLNADLTVGAKTIDITPEFRAQLRELQAYSDANPSDPLTVFTANGKAVDVTRAQLVAVNTALHNRMKLINDAAKVKADTIEAAGDLAAVAAVNLDQGWPA